MGKRSRSRTVRDLATELNTDIDEVLLVLWDNGFEDMETPTSRVPSRAVQIVTRTLGGPNSENQHKVQFWLDLLKISRADFVSELQRLGVTLPPHASKLPKGTLRRLRAAHKEKLIIQGFSETARLEIPEPTTEQPTRSRTRKPVVSEPVFRTVGTTQVHSYLDVDDIRLIHDQLEIDFRDSGDPIEPPGVKDESGLSSAASRPRTSLGNILKYETAEMAGAALFHSVSLNHAFYNGNKRAALVSLIVFLDRHKLTFTCGEKELFRLAVRTASHGFAEVPSNNPDAEVVVIAEWIRRHTRSITKEERPLKWLKLKKLLVEYGCSFEQPSGVGNRLNISRPGDPRPRGKLDKSRVFRITSQKSPRLLKTQVAFAGDTTEADKTTVHRIRKDLELDLDHGVDSAAFYHGNEIDSFIAEYRSILQRLGKI